MNLEIAKNIEMSNVFVVLLSKNYHTEPDSLEQFLYAKNLNKPMIIVKRRDLPIPDIFERCQILSVIETENFEETCDLLLESLNKHFNSGIAKNSDK